MSHAGIYAIVHKESGRLYVGSSINTHRRWRQHRDCLRRGNHRNRYLQNAWNAHGAGAFFFMDLEVVDGADLGDAERKWTHRLNALDRSKGFNIGNGPWERGRGLTEDHKAAIGRGRKGIGHTEEFKVRMSAIKTGMTYGPRTEASKERSSKSVKEWHARAGHSEDVLKRIAESVRRHHVVAPKNKWGVTGLTYLPRYTKPWVARLKKDGKTMWLGTHKTKEEAIAMLERATANLFGGYQ